MTQWRRALILGGIRSGKSEYAEVLVAATASVRYVATARRNAADAEWEARIAAHRARRPTSWSTEEVGDDPLSLPDLLRSASSAETLLVDDLGIWIASVINAVAELTPTSELIRLTVGFTTAVAACRARLVIVSPEVGLSLVPQTESARTFTDAVAMTNRAIAAECDAVALVIAGNAVPVKGAL